MTDLKTIREQAKETMAKLLGISNRAFSATREDGYGELVDDFYETCKTQIALCDTQERLVKVLEGLYAIAIRYRQSHPSCNEHGDGDCSDAGLLNLWIDNAEEVLASLSPQTKRDAV